MYTCVRLDLNKEVNPDIIADACNIPLSDGCVKAIYASHLLEHIDPRLEDPLKEWKRVLDPHTGEVFICVPNLTFIAERILSGGEEEPVYKVRNLNVTPLDMLYGLPADGMRHTWSFTKETLGARLRAAGFKHGVAYELRCVGEYDRCEVQAYAVLNEPGLMYDHFKQLFQEDMTYVIW
jgi:predicted SAM-dependent methyltransferase